MIDTLMGACSCTSKGKRREEKWSGRKKVTALMENLRFLEEEMKGMICEREKQVAVFSYREAEWKRERKKLKEEVKKLRNAVDEKDERIREMEVGNALPVAMAEDLAKVDRGWPLLLGGGGRGSFLVEQMREERARRDEAVEKWKQLYLAIKTELDELIHKTHGDVLCWKAEEEEMIEELKSETSCKDKMIENLKARIASMELKQNEKDREIDILRQSLRIVSSRPSLIQKSTSWY